jgi:sterol desaturase/sphingolipid hydroxylase (fatty acid hydroxylase superfamily)
MFWSLITQIFSRFLGFASIVTLSNWLLIVVGAAIVFFVRADSELPKTFAGFFRYCLPPEIIRVRSCRVDAVCWLVNLLLGPFLIAPFILGSIFCSTLSYEGLTKLFGVHGQLASSMPVWVLVAVVVTIAADFATFYTHYLDHKIAVMWEFHKVHHSAEFLTPITNKRFHPVEKIFDDSGVALAVGGLLGVFSYIFSMPIYENTIIGVDAYFLLNTLSFFHLRHSHINLSYGQLERWLLSPAQHQLHHSREVRHWDKNFGLFLSVWDRWFGTLAYSEPRGSFRLGLPGNEIEQYRSVLQVFTTPFINVGKTALNNLGFKRRIPPPNDDTHRLTHVLHGPISRQQNPGNIEDQAVAAVPTAGA